MMALIVVGAAWAGLKTWLVLSVGESAKTLP